MTTGSTFKVTWLDQDHLTAINPDTPQGRNPRVCLIKNGKEDNTLGFNVLAFTEDSNGTNPMVLLDSCWHNLQFTRSGKRAYLGARCEDIHDHDFYTPEDLLHHSPTPVPQDSKSKPEINPLDMEITMHQQLELLHKRLPHKPPSPPTPDHQTSNVLAPILLKQEQPQETHLPTMGTSNAQTITQTPTISQSSGVGLLGLSGSNPPRPGDQVRSALLQAFRRALWDPYPLMEDPPFLLEEEEEEAAVEGEVDGPPAGQPPATPQLPIAPAGGDVRQLRTPSYSLPGDRSQANNFINALGTYFRANIGVPRFESPIRKVAIALTLLEGDQVAGWKHDMGNWLDSLNVVNNNFPVIWDIFKDTFSHKIPRLPQAPECSI
jgi:hypothetical protein